MKKRRGMKIWVSQKIILTEQYSNNIKFEERICSKQSDKSLSNLKINVFEGNKIETQAI